jgi:RNA polymerase primary sigma factor
MDSSQNDRSSVLSRYFSEIRNYPLLTKDQEHCLARNVQRQGCQVSLNELIESNLSFVVKVASEYRNLGLPFEDLLNEGNLGLIEAAHRYDASKGTKFITYAIWWIRKSILKALSEHSNLVRVPSSQLKKVREIRDAETVLSRRLGRRPRRDEISARLERSLSKVDQVLQFNLREMSLDEKFGKDRDKPIAEFLVDAHSTNPEADLIKREASLLVAEAMSHLSDQERKVIAHRFGIQMRRALTLKEIGEMMCISRERVRQIECQAKSRLRKLFARKRLAQAPVKEHFAAQPCRLVAARQRVPADH